MIPAAALPEFDDAQYLAQGDIGVFRGGRKDYAYTAVLLRGRACKSV